MRLEELSWSTGLSADHLAFKIVTMTLIRMLPLGTRPARGPSWSRFQTEALP